MEFRILGPLEAWGEGGEVPLGGPKPRALLAALLLHPNGSWRARRLQLTHNRLQAPVGPVGGG
jgi:DNA-binding SARP family transcriptional activator